MLTVKDLAVSKELDRDSMAAVTGGTSVVRHPGLSLFSPVSIPSFNTQIAATNAIGGGASNVNNMINGGVNYAGEGSQIVAPVVMNSHQSNDNDLEQIMAQVGIQSSF